MASTYSTNLRLELIGTGEQQGTWGTTTNTNLGTLIEEAIGGYVSVAVTDGADTTLTTANGAVDQSRNMTINLTGALTATRNVICPAIEKIYIVKNATTGGFAVTFKVSGQTGVSIPNGATYLIFVDGTDARQTYGSVASQNSNNVSITGGSIGGLSALAIGGAVSSSAELSITSNITGATTAYGALLQSNALSDVTTRASGFNTVLGSQAAAFTLPALAHFYAQQGTFGAGSTVTAQYGFVSDASLIGATNNYGFFAGNIAAVTAGKTAYGFYSSINTATGGGTAWAFYAAGTAPSYFGGNIGLGTTGVASVVFNSTRTITGSTVAIHTGVAGAIQTDVTNSGQYYRTIMGVAASATMNSVYGYLAAQGTFGAGSAVTEQFGFAASGGIDATTNYAFYAGNTAGVTAGKAAYGFYSAINVATGGGTAWAYYGAGTANSYFGGGVGIGSTGLSGVNLRMGKTITGATTAYGILIDSVVQSDVTAAANIIQSNAATLAAAFTLTTLNHFNANQGAFGASSSVSTQSGFSASANLIGATTNYGFWSGNTAAITSGKTSYGFYSAVNIASGGGTTWGFYGAGTAWNYFAGPVILDDELWVDAPAPTAKSTTATLTAAELKTGIISTTGTSYTVTLPTGTAIDAGFSGIPANVDIGFDFSVVNTASGTITIAVNTGVTSLGTLTIATATSAIFRLRRTAANTYVVYRLA